ncbi:MAG: hypothetical protein ABI797_03195 [Chloroflexota bacterium]
MSVVAVLLAVAMLWVGSIPVLAAPNSLALRATYDVAAYVRWGRGSMTVSSIAHITNTTNDSVKALSFNLVPLVTGDAEVIRVTASGKQVDPIVSGQTIVVPLPKALAPNARTNVRIRYRARFNAVTGSRQTLLMQRDGVITAYRWIPWLSRKQPFAAPNFGETWVTAVSPRVTVTLTSRKALTFATSGRRTHRSETSQTFRATNVRDFNFSASPDYKVKRVRRNGITVRVFYRHQPADQLAELALAALERFGDRVGAYPYKRLIVAETPAGTGMESPALSWIASGTDAKRLDKLLTHEIAHQWFYATVGNNQGTQPFLDEAVAEFLTRDMLGNFRRSRCRKAALDGSVYDYSAKCYPEVVYIEGSRYLERYRRAVGDDAFWAGMSAYYDAYRLTIGGTRGLLDYLDAASGFDSRLHEKRFPTLYP